MRLLSRALSCCRYFLHRQQAEKELDEELHSYVALLADQKANEGVNPGEAWRTARIELGGVEQVKEEVRAARAGAWFDALLQDLRFGVRMLRKSPGFTCAVLLTLALGIGGNTAIFSVIDGALLHPIPFPDPDRLVALYQKTPRDQKNAVSYPNLLDWQRLTQTFEGIVGVRDESFTLTGRGEPEQLMGLAVSSNLLSVLRAQPLLGRMFSAEEDQRAAAPVVLLGACPSFSV